MKITHSSHRTDDQLEAETDWMLFLNSLWVEHVPVGGSYFSVVSYERPIGESLWNETLFRRWGTLIGKPHRLSLEYASKRRRYAWNESDFLNVETYIPISDHEIRTGPIVGRAR